tara:strand:- start:199816 stop:200343 length:528 start_codon:yes stop_codon:yes gene_type:complete
MMTKPDEPRQEPTGTTPHQEVTMSNQYTTQQATQPNTAQTTPYHVNQHASAAGAYRTTHVNTMSGMHIVVELYKGMISNVEQAKTAYLDGKLDQMCRLNDKTYNILVGLQTHLDYEQGGEAAVFLNQFYNTIFGSLSKVLREPDTAQAFDDILAAIHPVYQRWCEFARGEKPAAE